MDKKQAEDQARLAKEATGRAMFEKGDWQGSEDEDEGDDGDVWNLEKLRKETEAMKEKKEAERIFGIGGAPATNGVNEELGSVEPSNEVSDEKSDGS
jgi:hypothetical protein